jgi:hypothetical protein
MIVTTRHGHGGVELGTEARALRCAPDERRVHPPGDAGGARLDLQQPPRVDRLRLALQLEGGNRLGADGVAHQPNRRVADEDLPAAGLRLQALRDHDGVAGREGLALRRIARDHLAGVDAGANGDPHAVVALEVVVQPRQRLADLDGGPDRTERVVLVHDGDAERGHDGVADELLDRAAVTLEHVPAGFVVARPHGAQRLGIEALTQRRRVRDVAEDKRDGLPDHAASLGWFVSLA